MPVVPVQNDATHELPGTRFTSLATPTRGGAEVSVWHVEIQPGTVPVPHQLTRTEVFLVLAGEVDIRLGDEVHRAGTGDTVIVPPHTLFALEVRGDVPFRAYVCMPVDGQAIVDGGDAFTPPWAR